MRLEAAAKSARLRAEIDFLEHEGELRRLQLLKEASIADAEERAFKRIIDEDQISNNGKQIELPAYAEEKHVKTKSNIQFNPVSCIHDNEGLAEGKETDIIYLDFSKAFDKVPHSSLIRKLPLFGITGDLLLWFKLPLRKTPTSYPARTIFRKS